MALATLDPQELNRFARAYEQLFYRGDGATMAAFYAEDAKVMAPDSDPVRGRQAIEAFFTAASAAAQRTGMRRTIHVRRVERSGDLGYVLSTVVLELPRLAAGLRSVRSRLSNVTTWLCRTTQTCPTWRRIMLMVPAWNAAGHGGVAR